MVQEESIKQFKSSYFRELTEGNFLLKVEQLSQLENIGEGII